MLLCSFLLLHLTCFFLSATECLFFFQTPLQPTPPATQSPNLLPEVNGRDWLISNVPTVMVYILHSCRSSSSSLTPDLNVNPPVFVSSSSPSDSLSREPAAGGLRRRRRPQPLLHGLPVFPGQDALRRPRLRSLPHSLHPWPALQTRSAPRGKKIPKNVCLVIVPTGGGAERSSGELVDAAVDGESERLWSESCYTWNLLSYSLTSQGF